jgi:hypothetical protein
LFSHHRFYNGFLFLFKAALARLCRRCRHQSQRTWWECLDSRILRTGSQLLTLSGNFGWTRGWSPSHSRGT